MKGLKNFLPLLLLAVATRAIPLPEPRSIAMVSAHAAIARSSADEEVFLEKREVRGDLDTAEAETESVTEVAEESEMTPTEPEEGVKETPEEGAEETPENDDGVATTPSVEETHDGSVAEDEVSTEEGTKAEEGEEKAEEEEEDGKEEEEGKAKTEEANTEEAETEKPEEKGEGKKGEDEEKVDGRIGEEENHGNGEGVLVVEEEEGGKPVFFEEGPIYDFGPPIQGPFPLPLGPLRLDHSADDLPDHEVQQVGNDVYPPGKVIFPIYFIRIDHRYLQEGPYQGL